MGRNRIYIRAEKFGLLALIPLYFIVVGLMIQPLSDIIPGLWRIIKEPDFLITDYFLVGGIGAAFINAGILTLAAIGTIYFLGMEMDGHTITSSCLMFGFSLFGKNLMNIWAILLGVYLYSKYHKTHMSRYIYIGFYGTSLSPIITQIMYITELPYLARLPLSILVGIAIGFVLPPLATHVHYAHKGYSLYNVGFASGIIATVVVSVMKSFGVTTESRLIWLTGNNRLFLFVLCGLFLSMMGGALVTWGKRGICRLWPDPEDHGNFRHRLSEKRGRAGDHLQYGAVRPVRHPVRGGRGRRSERPHHWRDLYHRGLLLHGKASEKYCPHYVWSGPGRFHQALACEPAVSSAGAFILHDPGSRSRGIWLDRGDPGRLPPLIGGFKCGHRLRRNEPV